MKKIFAYFTKFEWGLLVGSIAMLTFAFVINPNKDVLTFVGSLIGAVALVFLAKANITGQVLTIVFSTLYGIVSFKNHYYGEVITYVCMTMPSNIVSIVTWLKHPFQGQQTQVEIAEVGAKKTIAILAVSAVVTVAFYFVLKALGTASLIVSTISIFTSSVAVLFGIFRSKYYAIGYATNDVVLIVLWV
ncbi:MAG: nicotinamide mononucleotide transporter, partial [Clostridia bacterium]|nr:nicotinamide mononucleotide transporter [Clostridia bacterium]